MKVVIKKPGKKARLTNINDSLKSMQEIVGGPIQIINLDDKAVMIMNEEGRLRRQEPNFWIAGTCIVGPVIFTGQKAMNSDIRIYSPGKKSNEFGYSDFGDIEMSMKEFRVRYGID